MTELNEKQFCIVKPFVSTLFDDRIFIDSALSGGRFGRVFVDGALSPSAALIWHRCGFAYLCGKMDGHFLSETLPFLYETFEPSQRCFRLNVYDTATENFFDRAEGLTKWKQYVFSLNADKLVPFYKALPVGFTLCEADEYALEHFNGKITPAYSWSSAEDFLKHGKGFCVKHGDEVAAMAFTCALGDGAVDIGIETRANFRGLGLGKIVASRLARYLLDKGISPVWRCASTNPASEGIALAVGFVHSSEHFVYMKKAEQ